MPFLTTARLAWAALVLGFAAPAALAATPAKPTAAGPLMANQKFASATAAQASCPADTVVWGTLSHSKAFHIPTSKYYGHTKHGAFICEKAALAAGFHQAKS